MALRPPYAEYVKYAMRAYIASEANWDPVKATSGSRAEQDNWMACRRALQRFEGPEQVLLFEVYGKYDTMPDNVYQAAQARRISQDDVWTLINRFEVEFAKIRGLI